MPASSVTGCLALAVGNSTSYLPKQVAGGCLGVVRRSCFQCVLSTRRWRNNTSRCALLILPAPVRTALA